MSEEDIQFVRRLHSACNELGINACSAPGVWVVMFREIVPNGSSFTAGDYSHYDKSLRRHFVDSHGYRVGTWEFPALSGNETDEELKKTIASMFK